MHRPVVMGDAWIISLLGTCVPGIRKQIVWHLRQAIAFAVAEKEMIHRSQAVGVDVKLLQHSGGGCRRRHAAAQLILRLCAAG